MYIYIYIYIYIYVYIYTHLYIIYTHVWVVGCRGSTSPSATFGTKRVSAILSCPPDRYSPQRASAILSPASSVAPTLRHLVGVGGLRV